jgi:hypothetical protein
MFPPSIYTPGTPALAQQAPGGHSHYTPRTSGRHSPRHLEAAGAAHKSEVFDSKHPEKHFGVEKIERRLSSVNLTGIPDSHDVNLTPSYRRKGSLDGTGGRLEVS